MFRVTFGDLNNLICGDKQLPDALFLRLRDMCQARVDGILGDQVADIEDDDNIPSTGVLGDVEVRTFNNPWVRLSTHFQSSGARRHIMDGGSSCEAAFTGAKLWTTVVGTKPPNLSPPGGMFQCYLQVSHRVIKADLALSTASLPKWAERSHWTSGGTGQIE